MNNISPHVSVVMPCYNEEKFIKRTIESLIDDYFLKECELIVVDGISTDKSREIVKYFIKKKYPIKLLKNKNKFQSYGINIGILEAKGEIIVRADAHCLYPSAYIKSCVQLLKTSGASNVGGIMFPRGDSPKQEAISLAMKHPAGAGDAKWHLGNFKGYTDTVYLGTFWKSLFDEIGYYDTNCKTNEDAEMNMRILKSGKKVYLDSSIKVTYFPRESLKALTVQYFKYGRGRCYTTLKHKKFTSFRQIGPIILVIGISLSIILSAYNPLFLYFPLIYFLTLMFISIFSYSKRSISFKQRILMGFVFLIMHVSWGTGFLSRLLFPKKYS